jgi:hypothetical protein
VLQLAARESHVCSWYQAIILSWSLYSHPPDWPRQKLGFQIGHLHGCGELPHQRRFISAIIHV